MKSPRCILLCEVFWSCCQEVKIYYAQNQRKSLPWAWPAVTSLPGDFIWVLKFEFELPQQSRCMDASSPLTIYYHDTESFSGFLQHSWWLPASKQWNICCWKKRQGFSSVPTQQLFTCLGTGHHDEPKNICWSQVKEKQRAWIGLKIQRDLPCRRIQASD